MIKWCIAIWNEDLTEYFCIDSKTNKFFVSYDLNNAVLFDKVKKGNPPGTSWLPVFVPDKQNESR